MKRFAFVALLVLAATPLSAQQKDNGRYDDHFRKYSKRFFGVGFDWQYFKAQGLAESDLIPTARSRVGARGIMQLMPGTYEMIRKNRSEKMGAIDDPEWNIAAGILHDRGLWHRWDDTESTEDRLRFMFGSYNAGEGPIIRARKLAKAQQLNDQYWKSIESIAPKVDRWRYTETLPYVRKIEKNHQWLREQPRRVNASSSSKD